MSPFPPRFDPDRSWPTGGHETSEAVLEQPQREEPAPGFRGKNAVITGGATGLGTAIAMEFARRGSGVAICYLNLPHRDVAEQALLAETALRAMGVPVYAARCDVRDSAEVAAFISASDDRLGGLHYLVKNAGIAMDGALWRMTDENWRMVMETNVTGSFNCIRAMAPILRSQRYGKIVNISAHQAERPGFGVVGPRRAGNTLDRPVGCAIVDAVAQLQRARPRSPGKVLHGAPADLGVRVGEWVFPPRCIRIEIRVGDFIGCGGGKGDTQQHREGDAPNFHGSPLVPEGGL